MVGCGSWGHRDDSMLIAHMSNWLAHSVRTRIADPISRVSHSSDLRCVLRTQILLEVSPRLLY